MEKLFNYIQHYNIIPKVIFDIGSRDLDESIKLSNKFPEAKVFAFECNPETLGICKEKKELYNNITLIDKAVNNFDGSCTFYPIDTKRTITTWVDGNPGASSLFKSNSKYPVETYIQNEITVDCVRIDTIMQQNDISIVDVVWMDLQGAELLALEGFGDKIKDVSIIHTEVEMNPMYENQCLFEDVMNFLKDDFIMIDGDTNTKWGTDIILINKKQIK
jgi:FkbM family methyltransferase